MYSFLLFVLSLSEDGSDPELTVSAKVTRDGLVLWALLLKLCDGCLELEA